MNKKILMISFLLLLIKVSWATVTASVDHSQLSLGQSLTLTINLVSSGDTPDLNQLQQNFEVYGTSKSSQTSIANGQVNSQTTFSVNLTPKNPGKQFIPAIKVGNDTTSPIQIEVAPASQNSNQALNNSSVYLDAHIAKQNSYIGVPVLYTIKLYYNVSLSNLTMAPIEIPNAQIEAMGKTLQYQSNENGKNYQVIEQKFLITPNKEGLLQIPPTKIKGAMNDNTNNNNFFAMVPSKPFIASSKPLTLQVKPIPANIELSDWLPAKGLNLTESWSTNLTTLKVGEPITRTISLKAIGISVQSIPEINFPAPAGVNAYPDKALTDTTVDNNDLLTTKTFKIAYIPTKSGNLAFPEIKLRWWDITTDSLKTAIIPGKSYNVLTDGSSLQVNTSAPLNQSQIHSKSKVTQQKANSLWYYLAIIFAVFWLITMLCAVLIFRKKSRQANTSNLPENSSLNPKKISSISNEQQALTAIQKACNTKNLNMLNTTLISWASLHFNRKIYTISDIADLISNSKLHQLINDLNLALYYGQSFENFADLANEITTLANSTKQAKVHKESLQEFYPK